MTNTAWIVAASALLSLGGTAAAADVPAGIAAWQAGDYARAIAEWRPLAEAGDADAQFNLGQAYRLGRGVPQDLTQAEQWFERAARQRHDQAGANLGLLLFQNGRAREAMPWIQAAALRGDPRAQYVFGTALFNGDVVRRDLPRAYGLMSQAAAQGFPQAADQLRQMEPHITPEDRQRGLAMVAQTAGGGEPPRQIASMQPRPSPAITASPRHPAPVVTAPHPAPPAGAAPRPGAGVSYAPPPHHPDMHRSRPDRVTDRVVEMRPPVRTPTPPAAAPVRAQSQTAGGRWRVQLGAFSNAANAHRQWAALSRRIGAVGALEPAFVPAGGLTRLRAGRFASRAAAEQVCSAVRAAGEDCIPVAP